MADEHTFEKNHEFIKDPWYSVKDVTELTGMKAYTVHYFDSSELVSPARDENGNRRYTVMDIFELMIRPMFKKLRYSIPEARSATHSLSFDENVNLFKEKAAAFEEQMEENKKFLTGVKKQMETLERVYSCLGNVTYMKRPAQWHSYYHNLPFADYDEKACKARNIALQYFPLCVPSFCLYGNGYSDETEACTFGWSVIEPYEKMIDFDQLDGSFRVSERMCLYTVFSITNEERLCGLTLHPVFQYMNENGLELDGAIYGNYIIHFREKDNLIWFYEAWIPVKDK